MRKSSFVALLLLGATVLGATALREPIASAAAGVNATIVGPLDRDGSVKVHEQGVVTVAAAPGEPLKTDEVDTPRFEPWQRSGLSVSLDVPAGRLAVVDYVSGRCFGGGMAGILVTTTEDGNEVDHWVPAAYGTPDGGSPEQGGAGQVVRFYAGSGTNIYAIPGGQSPCFVSVSGHLEW